MTFSKKILACCIAMPLVLSSVAAQNVGIGEANPASKLSVKGNFSVGQNYSTLSAPTNGAIIQGQTVIGYTAPLFPGDVLTVVDQNGNYVINGLAYNGIRSSTGATASLNTAAIYGYLEGNGGLGLLVDHEGTYDFGGVINTYGTGLVTAAFKGDSEHRNTHGVMGEVITGGTGYAVYANGAAYSSVGWYFPSDKNLKENIQNYNAGLSTIMSLKPKTYNYKAELASKYNFDEKPQVGFLAQELEEVMPALVKESRLISNSTVTKNKDKYVAPEEMNAKTVNYSALVPVLTAAIQEQQSQIEDLKTENETMKAQLQFLMQEVEALKKNK